MNRLLAAVAIVFAAASAAPAQAGAYSMGVTCQTYDFVLFSFTICDDGTGNGQWGGQY